MAIRVKIKRSTINKVKRIAVFVVGAAAIAAIAVALFRGNGNKSAMERGEYRLNPKTMYGIKCDLYDIESGTVGSGQTLSHLLGRFGLGPAMIDKVDRTARPVFNIRDIRAGHGYTAFLDRSDGEALRHFIYEKNGYEYLVFSFFESDSVAVRQEARDVVSIRRKETAEIKTSLWNAMTANDLPVALSCELEDIFGWSVDFFGLQGGDKITVIFDERYVDTTRIGIGRVWGAEFKHAGKTYYAIPYRQDNKISYWDENGNSLKKQFLKAPLKYSRISSKFSNSRLHPVHKIRRPHHGVDYAAPSGTPVVAIADGVVTAKTWDKKGGGNILKIKHTNDYVSGYLHLKGYAKGINVGTRVSQGQLIAYVGSTGTSTGPHLDFRIWKGGKAIDPLKLPSGSTEPISPANKADFMAVKDKILAELEDDVSDEVKITQL